MACYTAATALTSAAGADRLHLGLFFAGAIGMAFSALLLYRRDRLSLGLVLALGIGARLAVLWLPPGLSDDGFRYLWDGFVQHQGLNPYSATPAALTPFHDTELYGLLNSRTFYTVYPPLSQMLFWLSTVGMGENWQSGWYVWKTLCLGAEVGTLFVLRGLGARSMLLYALHPLPIIEMVGQAHTEAFMVLGLAVACRAAARGAVGGAGGGLAVAALTKLYPFLLAPFLVRSWRSVRALLPAAGLTLLVSACYLSPARLSNVATSLRLYTQYFEFNAGLYYALKETLRFLSGGGDYSKQLGPVLALVFAGVVVFRAVRHAQGKGTFARHACWILGAYLVCATTVHPWYLAGVLVVLPFVPARGWAWQVLALVSLATYVKYTGGPYTLVVAVGWLLWLLLLLLPRWQPRTFSRP